ncbi:ABC transporter permease [Parapedobacter indicus]|uniref:Duplicated orphan permease n=1 Tax=Parapedobacter indicus TaxID=1477437 RepID=A0A1I3LIK4_9SPHI|nr:ABC transporter permease [Parapedobacter indicus]PPL01478.1 putative permease [Parapedobacter indicus]SFI84547.1 duplicated orphan permease [Parapedobacter indicus]
MLQNHFKTAWRNIIRQKQASLINLLGLSLGIASALILFVIVHYEWSYDRFHTNYDHIYRIVTDTRYENSVDYNAGIPYPTPDALQVDMPQVKAIVPLHATGAQVDAPDKLPENPVHKYSEQVMFTTADFFQLFDATWLAGNAAALSKPNTAVLDRETATRFFGAWQQAVGQQIQLANAVPLQVAAIVEDAPRNSNFPYHLLVSFETLRANAALFGYHLNDWNSLSSSFQTFVLLDKGQNVETVGQQLDMLTKKYFEGRDRASKILHLQPLSDIHFDPRYGATVNQRMVKRSTLTTLALIGIFVLIMAAINFVNLSTAQALGKGKEIGVRKALGGSRNSLITQSFGETFLLVFLSVLVALVLTYFALPYIHHVSDIPETPSLLQPFTLLFLGITLVAMTFLSGLYPAVILSGFKPVLALKNKINTAKLGGISMRKGLVVVQFALAQLLMIGTLVAVRQMAFVRNADLGFNKEAVYTVQVPSDDSTHPRMSAFKQQLLQLPHVRSVSFASDVPSSDNKWSSNFYFDGSESEKHITFPTFLKFADADYFENYGLAFLAGHRYAESDTLREAVINEAMVQKLGLSAAEDAIGKRIRIGFSDTWMTITGVVKNFIPNSLREEIGPIIIAPSKEQYYVAGIKLDKEAGKETLQAINRQFDQLYPEHYLQAGFLDESIARFYAQEEKMALAYQLFALLALVISSIGLYGMISFMLGQKVKEIGIRKVLGASVASIVYLFSKEFIYLVAIAFCIAAPVAYYFMSGWLNHFVFRIHLGLGLFLVVMLTALILALLTIGTKALRAAMANPVDSLRDE